MKGIGNSIGFGARMHDTRLGRWMSVDPLAQKYPSLSPYNFVGNSPIIALDPDGKEIWIAHREPKTGTLISLARYSNGKTITYLGNRNDPYVNKVTQDLRANEKSNVDVRDVSKALEKSKQIHVISNFDHYKSKETNRNRPIGDKYDDFNGDGSADLPEGTYTTYDAFGDYDVRGKKREARVGLAHEQKHAFNRQEKKVKNGQTENGIDLDEVDAVNHENKVRKDTKDPKRTNYGGKKIPKAYLDK